jgi:hypothetical protein
MFLRLFHNGLVGISPSDFAVKAVLIHNPPNFFVVHDDLMVVFQVHLDTPPAPFFLALVKDCFNEKEVLVIFWLLILAFQPLVVAGFRYGCRIAGCGDLGC